MQRYFLLVGLIEFALMSVYPMDLLTRILVANASINLTSARTASVSPSYVVPKVTSVTLPFPAE